LTSTYDLTSNPICDVWISLVARTSFHQIVFFAHSIAKFLAKYLFTPTKNTTKCLVQTGQNRGILVVTNVFCQKIIPLLSLITLWLWNNML
jgi:hypothetical protein